MQKRRGDPAIGRTNPTTSSINHAFQRRDIGSDATRRIRLCNRNHRDEQKKWRHEILPGRARCGNHRNGSAPKERRSPNRRGPWSVNERRGTASHCPLMGMGDQISPLLESPQPDPKLFLGVL
jgi:hypothetical protein